MTDKQLRQAIINPTQILVSDGTEVESNLGYFNLGAIGRDLLATATQAEALAAIGAATTAVYSVTVAPGDWSGSDPSTAAKTISGILTTDTPILDLDLSSVLFADVADVQSDWGLVYRAATSTDTLTFYATSTPTEPLPIQIKVVR
jgi:hypothetical protein